MLHNRRNVRSKGYKLNLRFSLGVPQWDSESKAFFSPKKINRRIKL